MIARLCLEAFVGEVVRLDRRAESDGRKVSVLAIAAGPPDEADGLFAHDRPSQTAIATRPASASDIRYAVMRALSFANKNARQIAVGAIVSGANPILS